MTDTKGETTGEGVTDKLLKYAVYGQMLADWFNETTEKAITKAQKFELEVKKKFIAEPGQMKLLIVVDKLLTGFDAPSATYLYIDSTRSGPTTALNCICAAVQCSKACTSMPPPTRARPPACPQSDHRTHRLGTV